MAKQITISLSFTCEELGLLVSALNSELAKVEGKDFPAPYTESEANLLDDLESRISSIYQQTY